MLICKVVQVTEMYYGNVLWKLMLRIKCVTELEHGKT